MSRPATRVMDTASPEAIEITPEMIENGAEAILASYGGLDLNPSPSIVAERVFRAMSRRGLSHEGLGLT